MMIDPEKLPAREPRERPSPVALAAPAIVRRLEGTERLVALGNALYRGCFNVIAMIELEGPVTEALLRRALDEVQRSHECLRVEVVPLPGTEDQWALRETAERPHLEIIEGTKPDHWKEVWDRAANTEIKGLAWKIAWVRGAVSQLVVTFNHAISDASSLTLFFDALLQAMSHDLERVRELSSSRPILPTLHRLVGARWPLAALARIGYYRYLRPLRTVPFDSQQSAVADRRWCGAFVTLEADAVERLLTRCRSEKVTIGTALSAATILELAGRVRAREPSRAFDVALCTSIDLRRYEQRLDPGQMGLLVSVIHSFFRPTEQHTVWSLSREVFKQVRRSIARDEHRDLSLLPALIGPSAAAGFASEPQGRPTGAALLVSNSGRLAGLEHGPFRTTKMFATGSQAAWGSTLLLCVTTVGGRMCLHLGYPSPALTEESGVSFLDGIVRRACEACAP